MTDAEPDPLVREAIALQGFEEHRHAALLDLLTQRYEIPVKRRTDTTTPRGPVVGVHPDRIRRMFRCVLRLRPVRHRARLRILSARRW